MPCFWNSILVCESMWISSAAAEYVQVQHQTSSIERLHLMTMAVKHPQHPIIFLLLVE